MTWATRRRLIILGIIAAVIALALGIFYFTTIHQAPSCTDGKQNQGEEGVDCGGPCSYLCTESLAKPSARFVRALSPVPGRTDVIAYIDNPNPNAAARGLGFTIELYSASNAVFAKKQGTVDLPPSSTVPVFMPDFFSGSQDVARAFITFDTPTHLWYRTQDTRVVPQVKSIMLTPGDSPRITADALNPSATSLKDVTFIATVFDESGNAIAASRTVAQGIAPMSITSLVFTWPAPFSGTVSRIEVVPVIPLPTAP